MDNNIVCPSCGEKFELSQAWTHQFKDKIKKETEKEDEEKFKKEKLEIQEKERKRIKEELDFTLKNSANELQEAKQKNKELHEQLLELNKTIRTLTDKFERKEIEDQKKLNEEREKIKEEAIKNAQEKSDLATLEIKKQLEDTKKLLEDAQRKSAQKSQQMQGEVLELELENLLKKSFPNDDISPVGKGTKGGDILQTVRNSIHKVAGTILWETKRANWSNQWLAKLREDARIVNAGFAILVSETLPREILTFKFTEGVLITSYSYVLPLASLLRINMMQIAAAKSTAANKDQKLELLYSYLQSDSFRHRFEAYAEGIVEMQQDLETEKRSTQRLWKKREMQITRTLDNISSIWGELQGIVGSASLPDIKILSLKDGED